MLPVVMTIVGAVVVLVLVLAVLAVVKPHRVKVSVNKRGVTLEALGSPRRDRERLREVSRRSPVRR